jgi:ferritin-like metal-binding protein YciE
MAKLSSSGRPARPRTPQDIYHAEGQILALPKMVKAAWASAQARLRGAPAQTRGQVDRLEQVFSSSVCPQEEEVRRAGGRWRRQEGDGVGHKTSGARRGAIAAAQKIEHYEIAAYGCVCTCRAARHDQVHDLPGRTWTR